MLALLKAEFQFDSKQKFAMSDKLCNSKDFLRGYLFNAPKCKEFNGSLLSEHDQMLVASKVGENYIDIAKAKRARKIYRNWSYKRITPITFILYNK